MLKNIFFISVALAVIDASFIFYYQFNTYYKTTQQVGSGIVPMITVLGVILFIALWWIVYFFITKNFYQLWIPLIFVIIFLGYLSYSGIDSCIQNSKLRNQEHYWLTHSKNKIFISDSLGISFNYISQSKFYGEVGVVEKDTIVKVTLSENKAGAGALEVFLKSPEKDLLSFLKEKYNKTNPLCTFSTYKTDGYLGAGTQFPKQYTVVIMNGRPADGYGCPIFGMEYGSQTESNNYFLMDTNHADKYVFLSVPRFNLEAYVPKSDETLIPNWYQTISFR